MIVYMVLACAGLKSVQNACQKGISLSLESEVAYAKAIGMQTAATQAADKAAAQKAPPTAQAAAAALQPPQAVQAPFQAATVQALHPVQQAVYLAAAPQVVAQQGTLQAQVAQAAQLHQIHQAAAMQVRPGCFMHCIACIQQMCRLLAGCISLVRPLLAQAILSAVTTPTHCMGTRTLGNICTRANMVTVCAVPFSTRINLLLINCLAAHRCCKRTRIPLPASYLLLHSSCLTI